MPVGLQVCMAFCKDRYDPQLVKCNRIVVLIELSSTSMKRSINPEGSAVKVVIRKLTITRFAHAPSRYTLGNSKVKLQPFTALRSLLTGFRRILIR